MELLSLQRSDIILHLISDGNRREQEWKEREAVWKAQNEDLFQSRLVAATQEAVSSSQQTDDVAFNVQKVVEAEDGTPTPARLNSAIRLSQRGMSDDPSPARSGSRGPSPLVFASEEARMAFINQLFSPDSPYMVVRKEPEPEGSWPGTNQQQEPMHQPAPQPEALVLFPAERNAPHIENLPATEIPTLLISPAHEKERSSALTPDSGLVIFHSSKALEAPRSSAHSHVNRDRASSNNGDALSSISGRGSSVGEEHNGEGQEFGETAPKLVNSAARGRGFGAGLSDIPSATVSTLGDDEILALL